MIQLRCPGCGHTVGVGDEAAGGRTECPSCRAALAVPDYRRLLPPEPATPTAKPPGPLANLLAAITTVIVLAVVGGCAGLLPPRNGHWDPLLGMGVGALLGLAFGVYVAMKEWRATRTGTAQGTGNSAKPPTPASAAVAPVRRIGLRWGLGQSLLVGVCCVGVAFGFIGGCVGAQEGGVGRGVLGSLVGAGVGALAGVPVGLLLFVGTRLDGQG